MNELPANKRPKAPPTRWTVREFADRLIGRGVLCDARSGTELISNREPMLVRCLACLYEWQATKDAIQKGRWCARCAGREPWSFGRARKYAESMGGSVLSSAPDNEMCQGRTQVEMRCGQGHTFFATAKSMEANQWCRKCSNKRKGKHPRKQWLGAEARAVASRAGVLLSDIADTARVLHKQRLSLRCHQCAHEWPPTFGQLLMGQGCPRCANMNSWTIGRARRIAAARGGTVVSELPDDTIITSKSHILIRCERGHLWPIKPNNLDSGHWCETCSGKSRWTIGRIREIVEERGGTLLTELPDSAAVLTYTDRFSVKCQFGHLFETTTSRLPSHWCGECGGSLAEEICRAFFEAMFGKRFQRCRPAFLLNPTTGCRLELDGYCEELSLAFEHQGHHHYQETLLPGSKKEGNSLRDVTVRDAIKRDLCKGNSVVLVEIPELHTRTLLSELRNTIIRECRQAGVVIPSPDAAVNYESVGALTRSRTYLARACEYANDRRGECLSEAYLSYTEPLSWRCECGHEWQSSYASVVIGDSWCPRCALRATTQATRERVRWHEAIALCHEYAETHGGELLSTEYRGCSEELEWRCAAGHTWNASRIAMLPREKYAGRWCSECARIKRRDAKAAAILAKCQRHALRMGGSVQSQSVPTTRTPVTWVCGCGYSWPAMPAQVLPSKRRRGTWCPRCRRKQAGESISRTKRRRKQQKAME
jgi:hypothetical protein